MDENERYEQICEPKFDVILEKLDHLSKQLFQDNGRKSLVTRINENAIWAAVTRWLVITTSGAFIVGCIGLIFYLLKNAISK